MSAAGKRSKKPIAPSLPPSRPKRWRWIGFGAAFAAGLGVALYSSKGLFVEYQAARHFERATESLAARQHNSARAELRSVLQLQPTHREARRQLAELELRLGRLEHAFLEFQSFTEMHPQDADGWLGLVQVRVTGGQLEEAEAAAGSAVEAAPDRAGVRRLRADLRYRLGRSYGAYLDAQAAVERDPKDAAGWVVLSQAAARLNGPAAGVEAAQRGIAGAGPDPALLKQLEQLRAGNWNEGTARAQTGRNAADRGEEWPGKLGALVREIILKMQRKDWAAARTLVDSARQTYPGTMVGPWLDGILEFSQGHLDVAEKHLLEALAAAPRSHRVITNLAGVWSRQRGPAYAGDQLLRMAERDPGFGYPLPIAGLAFLEARQPARAEAAIRRAFDLLPGSAVPYRALAEFYLELDRGSEALAIGEEGLGRFPQDVELQLLQARISVLLGDREAAIRSYENVLSIRPDLDLAAGQLAKLLVAARKDEVSHRRALQIVRQLEFSAPSDPLVLGAMGWVYLKAANNARRARELLEAAAKGAPDELGVRFHLAVAYTRTGRADLARRELRAALDSGQPFEEEPDARRLLRQIGGGEPQKHPVER